MGFTFSELPFLNALLNSASAVLLVVGHHKIKNGNIASHRQYMIAAFVVSMCFLVSYIVYHSVHGSQPFQGHGWSRPAYFTILFSHTFLAVVNAPLSIITLTYGLRRNDVKHRKIARWTYRIWAYVSVTGVLIYVLLYRVFR